MNAPATRVELDAWTPQLIGAALAHCGLDPRWDGRRFTCVCPACGEREGFLRPPAHGPPAVKCRRAGKCDARNEVFALLVRDTGSTRGAFDKLRELGAVASATTPANEPLPLSRSEPSPDELRALWAAGGLVDEHAGAAALLRAKNSNPDDAAGLDLVRVVTGPLVPLWPFRGPRVVARMWNADGKHVACVGRSVVVNAGADKYRTSKHATGLIGGSLEAGWLGGARDRRTVVMVEGVTDWLWASLRCLRGEVAWPVIGYQAGNRGNVERVRWDGERVFVATDTDTAGDKFSCVIREAIGARATVERVRWDGEAKDLSAWDGDLVGLIQERLRGRQ